MANDEKYEYKIPYTTRDDLLNIIPEGAEKAHKYRGWLPCAHKSVPPAMEIGQPFNDWFLYRWPRKDKE